MTYSLYMFLNIPCFSGNPTELWNFTTCQSCWSWQPTRKDMRRNLAVWFSKMGHPFSSAFWSLFLPVLLTLHFTNYFMHHAETPLNIETCLSFLAAPYTSSTRRMEGSLLACLTQGWIVRVLSWEVGDVDSNSGYRGLKAGSLIPCTSVLIMGC